MSKYSSTIRVIYYPSTKVPNNKLNIIDEKVLEIEEQHNILDAFEKFYNELSPNTLFNESYFKSLHKAAFESLYDFAGIYRTDDITKGFTTFCKAVHLENQSRIVFETLKNENYLKDFSGTKEQLAEKITYYMSELNALHPFYEGNGRIIRMFFDLMVNFNGYLDIDYVNSLKEVNGENEFILASKEAMAGNPDKLYKIILNGLKK